MSAMARFRAMRAYARLLAQMEPEERRARLALLTPQELLLFDSAFEAWADDAQLPPAEDGWRTWLMMAGRGFGKTRAGAEWVHTLAWSKPSRIALVAASLDEARRVMVEGPAGILRVAKRFGHRVKWEPSKSELTWPRGTKATLYSADNPDGLRGPEHGFAWCDELAKWRRGTETWDNLQFGLRAGRRARALVTTTPRRSGLLERLIGEPGTVKTGGRTQDNINLPREVIDVMTATYGGTRLGAQELDGVLLSDVDGALWPAELLARCRAARPERFERVVVGVDPPAGTGAGVDACGIIVAGRCGDALYVIADASVQGLSPEGWANRVAAAAARWGASQIVAEANNGGAMVRSVLMAADSGLRVKLVHAAQGKVARADPVALRFEAGRAFLAGDFPELEAELAGFCAGGGYDGPGRSPDRADAMVWALTELGETRSGVPRVMRPPSPVHLVAAFDDGLLTLRWTRRSRDGWTWRDEMEVPLGEASERYRVRLTGGSGTVEVETSEPEAAFDALALAAAGSGAASVAVAQVGDRSLSRWAALPIILP